MSSNQAQDESEGAESHAPASVQWATASSSRRLMSEGQEEARATFFEMMNEWLGDYLRNCPNIPRPPPSPAWPEGEVPQGMAPMRIGKAPVDKLRKYGAEEFRANADDDAKKAKFWLENMIRVFDELSCTLAEYLKFAIYL